MLSAVSSPSFLEGSMYLLQVCGGLLLSFVSYTETLNSPSVT